MEDFPLISVITVTFNAEKTIPLTLYSLREQSFSNFEHLVIDGKSKDNTLQVVKDFALPQTVVISEPDKGLYDAMNKGLRLAKGKYVIFLNAGDAFHSSDTLAQYARYAEQNKDIIYGDTIVVDEGGKKIADRHLSVPRRLTFNSFSNGMLICHQAFMVKKELTPEYDLTYRFSADYDWCIKCIAASAPEKCVNLGQVSINYLSDGLTDKNKWKSLRERYRIMSRHYGRLKTFFKHTGFVARALKRGKL